MERMSKQQVIEEICKITSFTTTDLEYEDLGILEDMYIIYCKDGDQNKGVKII